MPLIRGPRPDIRAGIGHVAERVWTPRRGWYDWAWIHATDHDEDTEYSLLIRRNPATAPPDLTHLLHWSTWRRTHQARARHAHYRRRTAATPSR